MDFFYPFFSGPGEQVVVSGALLKGTSGFKLATLRLPVQLLNQYATDASKLVVLTNRNQTTTSSDMTCVAVLLHHNPRGHIWFKLAASRPTDNKEEVKLHNFSFERLIEKLFFNYLIILTSSSACFLVCTF